MNQKIRIKLKSYDHNLVDKSSEKIVRAVEHESRGAVPVTAKMRLGWQCPMDASGRVDHSRDAAPALHDAILSCFAAAGITPRIGQEALQMQTIVSLVSSGMGLALVPESVSNLMRRGVEYRPLRDAVPHVETGICWRRDNDSPVLKGFLDLLRKKR